MNTTEPLYREMPFSNTEIKQMLFKNSSRDEKNHHEKDRELSINNYLKTPEEIDAELRLEMNSRKEVFAEHKNLTDSGGRIFKNRNDNAYSPDNNPSGFMEENY